ncbi:DEAD/DEAH box helicase [Streptomyces sp. NPDC020983]|uniref:DEAD/DEAH box helicase n=1 Tax=Streptomyces sp. NPDC020983 TaxID=3365106 RepID=UPI0037BBB979
MTFQLRPYQADTISALESAWAEGRNRLAVVLPTGAGKTVTFAGLIAARDRAGQLPGRALVIAHREELLHQAAEKIRAVVPDRTVGIVKAERDETYADVVVASVQTLAVPKRREALRDVGLIVVDECHHAAAQTYLDVLRHFGAWRDVPTAGFTATLTRGDGGLGDVWTDVVYQLDILDLIEAGHLVDVRGKRVVVDGLDLDNVKSRGGDLQDGQLGQALEASNAAAVVAQAYREHAADRPGVIFTPTVSSAQVMAEVMTGAGIPTGVVWGEMPREDRRAVLARYAAGDLQAVANCMVLTEGFDAPHTSCAVIARPTKSASLYVQMAGRALRLSPETGKTDALILDVVGASTRHKLASLVDLSSDAVAEVREGQSLRAAAEMARAVTPTVLPVLRVEDIDVFGGSRIRWLRTYRGTWFIPAGELLLYLIPDHTAGGYRLRKWSDGRHIAPQRDQAFDLTDAMHWMEEHARRVVSSALLARAANWRSGRPTERQVKFCRFHRIPVPPGATAGDVSDLQDVHRASARLDTALVGAA